MSKNYGIVMQQKGEAGVQEIPIPKLRDDYVLVKVKAVALNPTDWKHIAFLSPPGSKIGCDYAGTVEEVGSAVTKPFKKGDRIAGFAHGGNAVYHEDGAFSNYITAKGDIQIVIPENLSYEEAATLGVGVGTVGQGLYQSLGLPLPNEKSDKKIQLLIYGGSTATGSLAIQFAKLSGAEVITTCSPRNFDYVKSLGADAVFDYNSSTVVEDIREYTKGNLTHAFDCISEGSSTDITVKSMSTSDSGLYSTLLPVAEDKVKEFSPSGSVKQNTTLAYTTVGEPFTFGSAQMEAKPEDFEFAKKFWDVARSLIADGKVKVHKPSVDKYGKGWEGVMQGMEKMKQGEVSGEKLVYTI